MNRLQKLAAVLLTLGFVQGFVALWWWALRTMSADVSTAHAGTFFGLLFLGGILLMAGAEL